jgi:FdhD protein
MARGRTASFLVTRIERDGERRVPDELVVEEPLEIRLDGALVGTTMRTPGADFELAVGLCHSDGLLSGAPVTTVRYCATGSATETGFNVVTVETGGRAPVPKPRLATTSSSCGLCGDAALAELTGRLGPLSADAEPVPLDVLAGVPERVLASQPLFARTGAVHAAAAFDAAGEPVVVREDIGRHNAVDKVIGRLLLDSALPASRLGLFVSGRASYEMVQKAWAAGFPTVLAVSAPSALAVEAARSAGMVLAGFAREGRLNIYSGGREPARLSVPGRSGEDLGREEIRIDGEDDTWA